MASQKYLNIKNLYYSLCAMNKCILFLTRAYYFETFLCRCTSEIDGVIWFKPKKRKAKPNECDITDTSRPMPTTCAFRANDRQDADASIMSYPFIDKVSSIKYHLSIITS